MPTMSSDANLMKFYLIFKNTRFYLYILADQILLVIIKRISLLICYRNCRIHSGLVIR